MKRQEAYEEKQDDKLKHQNKGEAENTPLDSTIDSTYEDAISEVDETWTYAEDQEENQLKRSQRVTKGKVPDRYGFQAKYTTEKDREPINRDEAINSANKIEWIKAMDEEIRSINKNNTWTLTELLKDKKVIGCKWIFKRKKNSVTGLTKYKARLVA